jgi:hypothetical protein
MTEEKNNETLPYGLAIEKLFLILEELKKRPSSTDDELGLRVGSSYPKAKSIAIELQLITLDNNQPLLTSTGKHIAWEISDVEKQKLVLTNIVQKYRPYDIALSRMFREGKDIIQTEFVQQIWAREMNFKLGGENLARSVSFFFQLLDTAGLGTIFIGRHGQKTRFVFKPEAKNIINKIQHPMDTEENYDYEKSSIPTFVTKSSDSDVISEKPAKTKPNSVSSQYIDDSILESDPNWSILKTDYFILKIQNRPEVWDLLNGMIPLYRKTLTFSIKQKGEIQPQITDPKMDVTPSE